MSDKVEKAEKTAAPAGGKTPEKKEGNKAAQAALEAKREENKRKWSVEMCMKAARRFPTEAAWKMGAPSSYKSAVSHGWHKDCVKVLGKNAAKESTKKSKTA